MSGSTPDAEAELKALWQDQALPPSSLDLTSLTRSSHAFQSVLRRRNLREWVAAALVSVVFGGMAFTEDDPWTRAGCAASVVGALFVSVHLARRGRPTALAADASGVDHLRALREDLRQQADLLRAVPRWYLAPLIPGLVLFNFGSMHGLFSPRAHPSALTLAISAVALLIQVAMFAVVAWANHRAAQGLAAAHARLESLVPANDTSAGPSEL